MQKDTVSIQILGSNQSKLNQHRSQISTLINKEITTVLYDSAKPIQLFKDNKPPHLLIVLLEQGTIEALNQLTTIPSVTRPALLIIAASNDQNLMRLAMQAGARDFFTAPFNEDELHKSLSQILFDLRRGQSKQGILTTVINAKGGSGGSFIACNLAHMAAELSDASAVLVDFDLQFGTQSLNLDIKPQHTIVEALNDVSHLDFDAIEGYMAPHRSGLRVLSTTTGQLVLPGEISADRVNKLLTLIVTHYDHIVVDLPRLVDPLSAAVLERSDQIVIIVQQSLAHMRDAKRLCQLLKSDLNISEKNIIVVINRYDTDNSLKLADIESSIQSGAIYTIPNDYDKVAQSINLGIPLFNYARKSIVTNAMISLAESLKIPIKDEFIPKSFFKKLFPS